MEGDLDEVKIQHLQVILETYDAKIEQLRKIDETISNKIADEETLGAEIADADDYLMELTEKRCTAYNFALNLVKTQFILMHLLAPRRAKSIIILLVQ